MDYYQKPNKNYNKYQQYQSSNFDNYNKQYTTKKKGDIFSDIAAVYAKVEETSTSHNEKDNYNYDQNYYNNKGGYYYNDNYSKDYYSKNYHKSNNAKSYSKKKKKEDQSIDIMEIKKYLNQLKLSEKATNTIIDMCEGNLDCLICNDTINTKNEIWQCETCFNLLHLQCIKEWINKLNLDEKDKLDLKWTCPNCNTNYIQKTEPVYDCYCGKYNKVCKNSDFSVSNILIPHSCGLICDKVICKHSKCFYPCHPGNHVTCNIIEKISCFCGKTTKEIPCLNPNKRVLCNSTCEKKLYCGKHVCKVKCHEDECLNYIKNKQCQECLNEEKKKFSIFLEKLEKMIFVQTQQKVDLVNVLNDYIFEGQLPCKIHYEALKTENNLKFILKLIQVSGDRLADNIRKFIPICERAYENSCLCKSKATDTLCYKLNYPHDLMDYLLRSKQIEEPVQNCTKICNTKKTCKNHTCNRICCELRSKKIKNYSLDDPNGYHICMLTCGKLLNCGIHNCHDFCHKSACKPCATIIRDKVLLCECGKTKLDPPYVCGSEPKCNFPCSKERKCEHACKKTCHKGDCGYCDDLTFKQCKCGKEVVKNVVCGDTNIPRCGKPCYEILECNVHFCQEICHIHNNSSDYKNKDNYCGSVCGREYQLCEHTCPRLCHGESDCNEFNCLASVKIFCLCKINSKMVKCIDLKKVENKQEELISCNEECKKHEKLKRIELAFEGLLKISQERFPHYYEKKNLEEIKNEDGITISHTDTKFDPNMINFAKRNLKLIIKVEGIVENALKNQTKTHEIQNLDKRSFTVINDFLISNLNLNPSLLQFKT